MKEHIKNKLRRLAGERGQSIVILALAVVILLVFVGIAIDVGLLYGRRIQLSRAVDAAALAAVMELPDQAAADTRARQFMRTNGIDPGELSRWEVTTGGAAAVGTSNFLTVTAQLPMDTMFLRFVGWTTVRVPAMAVAEFKSPIEVYASQHSESGVVGVVNLNVFGHDGNPIYGDAFSPLWSSEKPGRTCGCTVATRCSNDDWRVMLQGRNSMQGVYPFRIHVPANYVARTGQSLIQVEILDPDSWNNNWCNNIPITRVVGPPGSVSADSCSRDWTDTADTGDPQNPKWLVRMDQNVSFCDSICGHCDGEAVTTEYTLYYYNQNDRTPNVIAQYRNRMDANTDLHWVIPGVTPGVNTVQAGTSFRFNLNNPDYANVWRDEDGNMSFYLDVEGVSGPGGNGYDLWAGPPPTVTLPITVNERNVVLLNALNKDWNPHDSGGVVVWAIGFLPLNVNTSTTYTATLGYLPRQAAGTRVRISNFDLDRNTDVLGPGPTNCNCHATGHQCLGRQLSYFLVGVGPTGVYTAEVSCSSNFNANVLQIPNEFYGGYLKAVFETAQNDTTDWMLEYLDVVDNTYVRLIR